MKRKSLLTLTVLFATAAFTALSLSACANSEETATLPKGWEITDTDGNVDYKKLDAIIFDPAAAAYIRLGEKVGNAFKDGAKLK